MTTSGWILGLHLFSVHAQPGYERVTPGLYAMSPSGLTVGAFRNSEGGRSVYAGCTWQGQRFGMTVGAVSGYRRAGMLPLVVPSVRLGDSARLSAIPNPFGPWALHLSFERRW